MQSTELTRWREYTSILKREANDLVNVPIVKDGYAESGKPIRWIFMNLHTIALARFHKHFPFADPQDPFMDRIFAEVKKICAACMVKKFEARRDHTKYDYLKDATVRTNEWLTNSLTFRKIQLEYTNIIPSYFNVEI